MFYVPHVVWKNWEEGKIRMISEGMRGAMVGAKEERIHRQNRLVQYLVETLHMHNSYAFGYFICEALNFINVVSIFWKIFDLKSCELIFAADQYLFNR